jgi:MFS transporter, YNFM family, putative membrane transport protein
MDSEALSVNETRRRYKTMALVGFCAFLNLYMTQPLLPMLRALFNVSAKEASMTVSASVLAVAIASPVMGMISDAFGRKKIIVLSLLGLSVFTTLGAAASTLHMLILIRFFQGLFIPGVVATTIAYITEESAAGAMSTTMAVYVTGTVVGGFCGRFICGLSASHFGWRSPFLILGGLTFLGSLSVQHYLPLAKNFKRQTDPAESLRSLWMHLHNPQLLAIYAVAFHVLFSFVGAFTYIIFYLAAPPFHLKSAALGSLFFVYLIGAVITPSSGKLIDRIGNRKTISMAVLFSSLGLSLTLIGNLWIVITGLGLFCTGVFICQASCSGQVGKAAKTARSSAAGLYVSVYYAGGGVGGVLLGYVWEWGGWPACVTTIVALEILIASLAFLLWKDYR